MSVIGTTLKQPRVFAHDSVLLKDLPYCLYGTPNTIILTGSGDGGTGFEDGSVDKKCYKTYNETTGGYGVEVQVDTDVNGVIVGIKQVCDCPIGVMYSVGDILTVIWEESSAFTTGTNSTGFIKVDSSSVDLWDYGCPFSPMENQILTEKQIDDLGGVINYEANPPSLMQKQEVCWQCNEEAAEELADCAYCTFNPGAALYIGTPLSYIDVVMESGRKVKFNNIDAGTFLPILCLTVCDAESSSDPAIDKENLKEYINVLF